ncbi:TPM domain-containing protein [Solimonas sp. SE-A11]|uniref:TPM domain-containing protein n=1 Tax=Solimonas sp. SE-A11 TaxID=3054954 RepID=UPI00259C7C9A|nr:TPM domain-containing protein [Solimonas sp. SE-A11]MDM4770344.1 TPM domain-containing protein [Solimonas sp. SE-A11]
MDFKRLFRHLTTGPWTLRRRFPPAVLAAIEATVRAAESRHPGEIRFAVETALAPQALWRGLQPRHCAELAFARLGVWDTEHNNGVLIYLLLADHDVEIVADRGVGRGRVPAAEWEACCRIMEEHFRAGRFQAGAVAGVEAVAAVLARYPPVHPVDAGNELPDRPAIL